MSVQWCAAEHFPKEGALRQVDCGNVIRVEPVLGSGNVALSNIR